jgi:hypothetical protein
MISSFRRDDTTKLTPAEAIQYYDPDAVFKDSFYPMEAIGGFKYGHELCYYSKSFLGESLRLTTRIMDLNRNDTAKKMVTALKGGLPGLGTLPMFTAFLPYVGLVQAGLGLFETILDFLTQDRPIAQDHDVDLHFDRPDSARLQSGRYVCVPEGDASDLLKRGWRLENDSNRLVDKNGGEYGDTSYFVLQVDGRRQDQYEGFDHYAGAAELLGLTNRRGPDVVRIVDHLSAIIRGAEDARIASDIRGKLVGAATEADKQKILAQFKLLSAEMQQLMKPVIDRAFPPA